MDLLWAGLLTLLVVLTLAFINKWFDERIKEEETEEEDTRWI